MDGQHTLARWWEHRLRELDKKEVSVFDVTKFPVYGEDFLCPHAAIVLNICGNAHAQYDKHAVSFSANEIAVLLPDHILCPIDSSRDYHVRMLLVSDKFLKELRVRTLSHDYSKFHMAPSSHLTEEQFSQLLKIVDLIKSVTENDKLANKHEILIYLLNIAFEFLNVYRQEQDSGRSWRSKNNDIFNRFCDLLAHHYNQSREVGFYAEKLCISSKYFSKIIQQETGVSAADWITEYVIIQAKKMLATRIDLNIQGISNLLGFADQAAFSRYFHRVTGESPKDYRKKKREENEENTEKA